MFSYLSLVFSSGTGTLPLSGQFCFPQNDLLYIISLILSDENVLIRLISFLPENGQLRPFQIGKIRVQIRLHDDRCLRSAEGRLRKKEQNLFSRSFP